MVRDGWEQSLLDLREVPAGTRREAGCRGRPGALVRDREHLESAEFILESLALPGHFPWALNRLAVLRRRGRPAEAPAPFSPGGAVPMQSFPVCPRGYV